MNTEPTSSDQEREAAILAEARVLDAAAGKGRWAESVPTEGRFMTRWRRSGRIVIVVALVFALSPAISRVIDAYRAVVLEFADGEMLIMEQRLTLQPPRWVDAVEVEAGTMVHKQAFRWSPAAAPSRPEDAVLLGMFARWNAEYEGTITKIRAPYAQGAAQVATIATHDGRNLDVTLAADHLATAAVGHAVRKTRGSWDPVLVSPGATFAMPPR